MGQKGKVETVVVTCTEVDSDSVLPASPDIAKRSRSFTFARATSWRTWRDKARQELKSMRWLTALTWTSIAIWTYILLYALVSLSILTARNALRSPSYWKFYYFLRTLGFQPAHRFFNSYWGSRACQPNGSFTMHSNSYQWWSMDDFFEITIGYTNLSFTQAKVIDVLAGSVSGRFGQAIVGYVSWRVFADYLTTSMATTPTTYVTFWIVFLHREPSLAAWLRLLREFWRGRVLSSKVAMAFMALTMLFVISIPTLTSSMTGYTPAVGAFIRTDDSIQTKFPSPVASAALLAFRSFEETLYIIHDGSRVGLTDDYPVSFVKGIGYTYGEPMIDEYPTRWSCALCTSSSKEDPICFRANVSSYVQTHGFYGLDNTTSKFMATELGPPALNISVSFIPGNREIGLRKGSDKYDYGTWNPDDGLPDQCWGQDWTDPRTGIQPGRDTQNRRFQDRLHRAYTLESIQSSGTCQPVTEHCPGNSDELCRVQKYMWGFSYVQLFLNVVLYLLWTLGLYVMWLKSRVQLPLRGSPEVPRGWRALIHLGETMRRELDRRGIDPEKLTDRQLRREIRKQLHGGSVTFDEAVQAQGLGLWGAFQSWCRRGKNLWFFGCYIGMAVIAVAVNICAWYVNDFGPKEIVAISGYVLTSASIGMLWAMALGRSSLGKAIYVMFWTLVVPGVWYGIVRVAI